MYIYKMREIERGIVVMLSTADYSKHGGKTIMALLLTISVSALWA